MTCTKTRKTGTQKHRNTLEHSGTPQSTPEHPRAPRNTGTAKKTRNTEFDDVVRKKVKRMTQRKSEEIKLKKGRNKK